MSTKFKTRYQCAVFGNFDSVSASPDVVKFMIENLMSEQLIPTQYQEQSIALGKDHVKHETKARLLLKSFDQKFEIKFLSDRCDFTYNDFIYNDSYTLNDFKQKVVTCLEILSDRFTAFYNRVGLVVETFHENLNLAETVKRLNSLPQSFSNGQFIEMSNRVAVRKKIDGVEEVLNHIIENVYFNGEVMINKTQKSVNGIRSLIDINTLPQDVSNRFNVDQVSQFLDNMIPKHIELQEENSTNLTNT